jgi:hypothetical protein
MEVYIWVDSIKKTEDSRVLITASNSNVTHGSPTIMWYVDTDEASLYHVGQVFVLDLQVVV